MGRRALFLAILFVLSLRPGSAQTDSLQLSSGTAAANGTVSLSLTLTSPAGSQPAALQWTLTYPPSNVVSISAIAGTAATNAGKTLTCASGAGTYTCLADGLNAAIIANGTVGVVNLTIASGVTSTPIGLTNTVAVSPGGSIITDLGTGGVVTGPGNPAPTITTLAPTSATPGGAAFTLTVNGSGFVSGSSVVNWNGTSRTTTFVSATQLKAAITAADIIAAGTAQVTVFNPTPGGGTSGNLAFTISLANNPAPTITLLAPASGTAGGAAFTLTVTGTGFVSGSSVVKWNGSGRATTFVSASQLQAAITAADIGTAGTAQVTVCNPTPGGGASGSLPFTINPANNPVTTASYVKVDTATAGNWKGVYGADGSNVINDTVNYPSYVTVTPSGITAFTWVPSTTDGRALQKASSTTDRIAACWYTGGFYTIDLNFNDTNTHQLALYFLDWDGGRSERVDILDAGNNVLDTRTVSGFGAGEYLVWNVSGHVVARVTNTGSNAVVSGIFFGSGTPANNPAPAITSLAPSSATAGGAAFTLTVNGTGFVSGSSVVKWNGSGRATTFVSAAQLQAAITASDIGTAGTAQVTVFNPTPGGGTTANFAFPINPVNNPAPAITSLVPASATAGGAAFTLTVNGTGFVSGSSVVKWNGSGRATTFVSAAQLQAAITAADIGTAGTAQVTVFNPTPGGGTSGNFAFPINPVNPGTTASYVKTDTTTAGNWKGVYGADGSNVINNTVNYPSYVTVTPSGIMAYTWVSSTTDGRALQKASSTTDRIAACWYTGGFFTIDLNFSDTNTHQMALYLLDWDGGRSERVDILDTNNNVLDTRTVSGFGAGEYLVWNVSGHVVARVTNTGSNAVVSGIFFGSGTPANNPAPAITSLAPSSATAGGAAFTLTVNGTGFVSGSSVVNWNGSGRPTTYLSATQLQAAITAADIGTVGTAQVTVFNPLPGGGTSGTFALPINPVNNPAPTITSLAPSSATAGGAAFTLTVNGTGFLSGSSVVNWNGSARATTYLSATQLQAAITAADIGAAGTAQVTVVNSPGGGTSGAFLLAINPANNPGTTASYVKTDTTTAGNWKGVYGADGFNVINDTVNYPSYVTVTPSANASYTWVPSTSDGRALQKALSTTDRIAACWYTGGVFTIDLKFNDTNTHQVALYFLDWDGGRSERVDILDASNNVLDTRTVSAFTAGEYLVWNVSGHVVARVTNTGSNAVVSGIFLSTPAASGGTASYVKTDTTTAGTWKGVYGSDGYNIINDTVNYPSYVTVTPSGNAAYTWISPTSDMRALQKASSATDRIAACWYTGGFFTIDLKFSDTNTHALALYLLDWDGGRSERVDILDAGNNLLDTRTVSAFTAGQYLVWNVSGHVVVRITNNGSNAVLSGIFFGNGGTVASPPSSGVSATYLKTDTTTAGTWKGVYGADGSNVINDTVNYPSYVTVTPAGNASYTWVSSTSDGRALQKASSATDRIAACWYTGGFFTIDLNISDTNTHQVALYFLDWDGGRSERVDILDTNNNVLDTRTVSGFGAGEYLVWNVSGHVVVRITNTASNAVVSGIFFR